MSVRIRGHYLQEVDAQCQDSRTLPRTPIVLAFVSGETWYKKGGLHLEV